MSRLELFYPVKPWNVTQPFGVNGEYYRANGINIAGHNGLDLQATHGQPVYASHDGTVVYSGMDGKEGVGVVIRTDQPFEYDGGEAYIKSIYWHLINNVQVKVGQKVKAGTLVGYADNTGFSTGDHLHFAIKPQAKGENDWTWHNSLQNNGYGGAIDPTPYFNKYYAQDAQVVINTLKSLIDLLRQALAIQKLPQ